MRSWIVASGCQYEPRTSVSERGGRAAAMESESGGLAGALQS